jgi:O-antigen ligase
MISNEDSFGPLMGMGIGYCYYYAQSVRNQRLKWVAYVTTGLCIVGVVSSMARGAVLSAGLVMGLVWLRSPRKLVTLAAGIAAAIIGMAAIAVIHPENAFWEEMATISEGNEAGTGLERWVMWNISLEVFKERPIFGAGPNNVGAVAYKIIPYDPERPQYSDPIQLYNKKLHNIFLQVLSEQGLVGAAIWLTMLGDFFLRLRRLRTPSTAAYWRQATNGHFDVGRLSLGLECAMVGYLANGFFYNQIYIHWFWTLTGMTYLLTINTGRPRTRRDVVGRADTARPVDDRTLPEKRRKGSGASGAGSSLGRGLIDRERRTEPDRR